MAPNPSAQMAVLRVGLRQRRCGPARGRLRRGARHRHAARRSDRGARAGHGAGQGPRGRRAAADRRGQVQPRPPRGRRRYRRASPRPCWRCSTTRSRPISATRTRTRTSRSTKLRLKVVAEHTDWAPTGRPRRAGISSFGFGGTNAHVVIEQAPVTAPAPVEETSTPAVTTLVVSGKTPERIASQAGMLADWMAGAGVRRPDLVPRWPTRSTTTAPSTPRSRTVARPRHGAGHRRTAGAGRRRSPRPAWSAAASGHAQAGHGVRLLRARAPSGPGWPAACSPTSRRSPQALAEIEPVFVEQVGFSLHDIIANGEPVSGDAQVQPVLMGLQLALTELWRSYGVHPDAVIGHSMGEVTAAVVAGALTLRRRPAGHRPALAASCPASPDRARSRCSNSTPTPPTR